VCQATLEDVVALEVDEAAVVEGVEVDSVVVIEVDLEATEVDEAVRSSFKTDTTT